MHGSRSHGYGSHKKHRGAGHRGGRGNAGSGKRGDAKKPSFQKAGIKQGKFGFRKKNPRVQSTVSLDYLETKADTLLKNKQITQEANILKHIIQGPN